MYVAHGNRKTIGWYTCPRELNTLGVGASEQQNFTLIRELVFLSGLNHPLHHTRIGYRACILDLNTGTLAQSHFHLYGIWRIRRGRDVYRDAYIRVNPKGRGAGTAH